MEENLLKIYLFSKEKIIEKGFESEINWCKNIRSLDLLEKDIFFKEYVWVVVNSGMKNKIAEKIFDNFWNSGKFNFDAIKHPNKRKSIEIVYKNLNKIFEKFKKSKNQLNYLEELPHIGPITKYHLARNIGLDFAKPDRHLTRISSFFGYSNVQIFCKKISELSGDKISLVDLILWRFATLFENYLEIFDNINRETILLR